MTYNQDMRLLFVADGRSPIANNWIQHFVERGDQVYLVSTFSCEPKLSLQGFELLPVAFSSLKKTGSTHSAAPARVRASTEHWRPACRWPLAVLPATRQADR